MTLIVWLWFKKRKRGRPLSNDNFMFVSKHLGIWITNVKHRNFYEALKCHWIFLAKAPVFEWFVKCNVFPWVMLRNYLNFRKQNPQMQITYWLIPNIKNLHIVFGTEFVKGIRQRETFSFIKNIFEKIVLKKKKKERETTWLSIVSEVRKKG